MPQNFAEQLRDYGLSVTAQRLEILRVVSKNPHISADRVSELATRKLGAISKQSVYDTLNTLSEKGLLRRIQPTGSSARYEDRINDNHHHIMCRSCGMVADVDCSVGRRPCLTASETHGFVIDEAEVVYWGYCPACQ